MDINLSILRRKIWVIILICGFSGQVIAQKQFGNTDAKPEISERRMSNFSADGEVQVYKLDRPQPPPARFRDAVRKLSAKFHPSNPEVFVSIFLVSAKLQNSLGFKIRYLQLEA